MLGLMAIVLILFVSPLPQTILFHFLFEQGAADISRALARHVPPGIVTIPRQHYRSKDRDAYLDVYYPSLADGTAAERPTVVWVHGGAWISGNARDISNYLKIVASYGYTVVGVDYSIAPGSHYPKPVLQVNDALTYLQKNSARLHIDPAQIVLAGDSAGAQIAVQVAMINTDSSYSHEIGIQPALHSSQLKAMILTCGAYDLALAQNVTSVWRRDFIRTIIWAYLGSKNPLFSEGVRLASVANYVTRAFPPTFITAGNADPLESQSQEFAKRLSVAGVALDVLFYSPDHEPPLGHEYQFNLDSADGQYALVRMLSFLHDHV